MYLCMHTCMYMYIGEEAFEAPRETTLEKARRGQFTGQAITTDIIFSAGRGLAPLIGACPLSLSLALSLSLHVHQWFWTRTFACACVQTCVHAHAYTAQGGDDSDGGGGGGGSHKPASSRAQYTAWVGARTQGHARQRHAGLPPGQDSAAAASSPQHWSDADPACHEMDAYRRHFRYYAPVTMRVTGAAQRPLLCIDTV